MTGSRGPYLAALMAAISAIPIDAETGQVRRRPQREPSKDVKARARKRKRKRKAAKAARRRNRKRR